MNLKHKFSGSKDLPCVPCIIEKELYPLIDENYENKIKILKVFEKIIVRDSTNQEKPLDNSSASLTRQQRINNQLTKIQSMIYDNADKLDVLSEIEILQFEVRYIQHQKQYGEDQQSFLKGH